MNKVVVRFCFEVYDRRLIERAVRDYSDVLPIQCGQAGNCMVCVFEGDLANQAVLEFGNYLVELWNAGLDEGST